MFHREEYHYDERYSRGKADRKVCFPGVVGKRGQEVGGNRRIDLNRGISSR
mgnify:CR=1 FL=1